MDRNLAVRVRFLPEEERSPPLNVIRRQEVCDEQQGVLANDLRGANKCQAVRHCRTGFSFAVCQVANARCDPFKNGGNFAPQGGVKSHLVGV
jgi:hypothetical protein